MLTSPLGPAGALGILESPALGVSVHIPPGRAWCPFVRALGCCGGFGLKDRHCTSFPHPQDEPILESLGEGLRVPSLSLHLASPLSQRRSLFSPMCVGQFAILQTACHPDACALRQAVPPTMFPHHPEANPSLSSPVITCSPVGFPP